MSPLTADLVDAHGDVVRGCDVRLLGDYLAALGGKNGWVGVIVWGAVRDTVALGALDFGVMALGSNPLRPRKTGAGQLDVPVEFGGAVFRPGDWVYSDADGIVVSNRSLLAA